MANDIAGIKAKLNTLLSAVTGIDKVYSYGIKNITAYTCVDIWWDGVEEFVPETNATYRVGWKFELTLFIKAMDRKNADEKLQTVMFLILDKLFDYPSLDFATYVDSFSLGPIRNGETNAFKDPYIYSIIPITVYTEETRTG